MDLATTPVRLPSAPPPRDAQDVLLERFERAIHLPAYLASCGYRVARDHTSPERIAMRHPHDGSVLVVSKDPWRRKWSYHRLGEPSNPHTVADFIRTVQGLGCRACTELLVACVDERRRDIPEAHRYRESERHMSPELEYACAAHLGAMEKRRRAGQLLERVGVAPGTLDEWRFGAVRNDADVLRMVGDLREEIAASRYRATDQRLVLVERLIDAVAYERRHGKQHACYIATGDVLNEHKSRQVAHLLAEVRPGLEVVLGYGRDRSGQTLAREVQALAPMVRMHRQPPDFGARWSDQMQLEMRHQRTIGRSRCVARGLERGLG